MAEIGEEYSSSLADLTVNSKPLINVLTILAEESVDHAPVIVQTVEKHLDKVHPDIKLPVLYLVDSIIKNVGGPYTQLFSQIIVNMFCRTFKQVNEDVRAQMFKLRHTWGDVFPSKKLYQLDVKVKQIDGAWPIHEELTRQVAGVPDEDPPHAAANIHLNPNFLLRKTAAAVVPGIDLADREVLDAVALKEQVAQKEQELKLLQQQTKLLLKQKTKAVVRPVIVQPSVPVESHPISLPSAVVAVPPKQQKKSMSNVTLSTDSGSPPYVSSARRRDPRIARGNLAHQPGAADSSSQISTAFEPKHQFLNKGDKTIRFGRLGEFNNSDVSLRDDKSNRSSVKKDPRLKKTSESPLKSSKLSSSSKRSRSPIESGEHRFSDKRKKTSSPNSRPNKLPPIPKVKAKTTSDSESPSKSLSPAKSKKESSRCEKSKKSKSNSSSVERKKSKSPVKINKKEKTKPSPPPNKYDTMDLDPPEPSSPVNAGVTFKELKSSTKERNYIRRNKEKSESPERIEHTKTKDDESSDGAISSSIVDNGATTKDVDLRLIPKIVEENTVTNKKRPLASDKNKESPSKKSKTEKFDALFGAEDVDLRTLPIIDNLSSPPSAVVKDQFEESSKEPEATGWARVKEIQSPHLAGSNKAHLAKVRAKLAEATKTKDPLGRQFLYKSHSDDSDNSSTMNAEDVDMRQQQALKDLDDDAFGSSIKTILSQAEENLHSGDMDKQQYNDLLRQVLQISEAQKLKQAQQKDSLEMSKRRLNWVQKQQQQAKQTSDIPAMGDDDVQESYSPRYDEMGDIDERFAQVGMKRPPLLPRPDLPYADSDLRMPPHYDMPPRYPGRFMNSRMHPKGGWRGTRPRMDDRGGWGGVPPFMYNRPRLPRMPYDAGMGPPHIKGPCVGTKQMECPLMPYVNPGNVSPPMIGTPSASKGLNCVDPKILEYIDQDPTKTIQIDGSPREIRYYDKTAVVMLNWDDPREIAFEKGHRKIFFDDESFLLNLNCEYMPVTICGQYHNIRFGAPTRELYIDDSWFECFFGGPAVPIMIDGKVKYVRLEGPPPQVRIGKTKRTDLVAGKINLIVDATAMHPVFLDAKLQKFDIGHSVHTLRFVDSLETILIDEKPFKVEFGGLPKPLFVGNRKHYVRFSVLPRGIVAGNINIQSMEGKKPSMFSLPDNLHLPNIDNINITPEAMSAISSLNNMNKSENTDTDVSGGLDVLASVLPSTMAPASQFEGYSVAEADSSENAATNNSTIPGLDSKDNAAIPQNISAVLQNLNVNDLFAKLVATGIVSTLPNVSVNQKKQEPSDSHNKLPERSSQKNTSNAIRPVNLMKSETLKIRQPGLISLLHTGMQCGSCGVRFPPEHTVRYSQHLDWHFRQNRADRHSQRRQNSRRWYYDISDWIQYQEIEDLEEREKSWFEREQQAAEAARTEEAAVVAARRETSSVPLKSDAPPELLRCFLCHDSFQQFYNHDTDEWHLRNAVEYETNNYHPICLDDHKASLNKEPEKPEEEENKTLIELDKEVPDSEPNEKEDEKEKDAEDEKEKVVEDEKEKEEPVAEDTVSQDKNVDEEEESVVEVLSEGTATRESTVDDTLDVEVLEEDDDVVIKYEPVEQIVVDDVDTDEETERERQARDAQPEIPVDFANVKIKQEPIDPDDEPIITSTSEVTAAQADTTHAAVLSSIDGNVQLEPTNQVAASVPGGIRINITKPLVSAPKEKEGATSADRAAKTDSDESSAANEEAPLVYKLKPSLEGKTFTVRPPTQRGSELSGLCSIQ